MRFFETFLGFLIVTISVCFGIYAYQQKPWAEDPGYVVYANFDKADGLNVGTEVKISGVKVGRVAKISLDKEKYQATVTLHIQNDIRLPQDTAAWVTGEGLLGPKSIQLMVGNADQILSPGNTLDYTQSATNIDAIISRFMFSSKKNHQKSET